MNLVHILFLSLFLLSCSAKKAENKIYFPGHQKSGDSSPSVRIVASDTNSESSALKRAAPEPVLLPPEALREVYRPVFGAQPRNNPTLFFSVAESDDLGGYRIITANNPRAGGTAAEPAMVWLRSLSSDYLFALRRFAGDACNKLITAELRTPGSSANKLVQEDQPSEAKINDFLSSLLGYRESGNLHPGIDKYLSAFEKMKNAEPKPTTDAARNERLRSAYNHLCAALATDVRVYYR